MALHGRRLWLVLGALMLGRLLAALDQTILATALPMIVGDLGGASQLSWIVTAYLLASTASTPLWGKLGDMYDRKRFFQAAIVIFLVGSALSGLSQSMGQLIAFRALQGIGGGGLLIGAQTIVGDVVAPADRGRYQGLFGAMFGVTSVLGPLLGGLLVDNASWRWVFYINIPVGIGALLVTGAFLPTTERRVSHVIDYVGAALITAGTTCLVLMTSLGGTTYPWGSVHIVSLGVAGVVLLVGLFVAVERRAQEPILAMRLFKNRVFGVSLDQLVRRRLVATDPGGDAITLTEDGRSGIERLCAAREDDLRELLDGWSPEQDPELDERLRSLARDCINADAARLRRDERLRSAA